MFKDKKEELQRLEAELLQEARAEEEEARLQAELEEAEDLLDDEYDYGQESEETYYNYSNRYGTCRAYNTDRIDGDLDEFSDAVYKGKRNRGLGGWILLAAALLVGIVVMLGWCVLRLKGIV